MADRDLADKHLSELHAEAARVGVPGYRMLRRDELIDEIAARAGEPLEAEEEPPPKSPPCRRRAPGRGGAGGRSGAGRSRARGRAGGTPARARDRAGVGRSRSHLPRIRLPPPLRGLEATPGDVYISASQIRRCELRIGDLVSGPRAPPSAASATRPWCTSTSSTAPSREEGAERPRLEDLTAVPPRRASGSSPTRRLSPARSICSSRWLSDSACSCGRRRDRDERRCSAASPARSSAPRSGPRSSSCWSTSGRRRRRRGPRCCPTTSSPSRQRR